MPRQLRIEFEGAIYHVMARGSARQKIVRDDAERRRLIDGREQAVFHRDRELLCHVVMGNQLHLLAGLDPRRIVAAVADFYGMGGSWLSRRGDCSLGQQVAAWLCPATPRRCFSNWRSGWA
jgi:hypothetical protein